jgi:hypothetical protein
MMSWTIVNGMAEIPNCCTACGGNSADFEGNQQQALWAEGVDIDWGGNLYLCWECGNIIASLVGRTTKEGFDALTQKYEALLEAHAELEREHEETQAEVDRIREGVAARRRIRERAAR